MRRSMPAKRWLSILDGLLFLVTLAGLAFVPNTLVPFTAWAAILGGYNLAICIVHTLKAKSLPREDIGRLLAGVAFTASAVAFAVGVTRPIPLVGIIVGTVLLAGLLWSALGAVSGRANDSRGG